LKNRILLIALFFGLSSLALNGQRGGEIGGFIGTANYFGDLNTNFNLKPGLAIGFLLRRNFNERLSVAGGVTYGRISANDADSNNFYEKSRNLNFSSNVFDFNATLEFNFFPYIHGSDDNYYTPYIFGGFSFLKFNPTTELDGTTYSLRDFGTEGQLASQEYGLFSGAFVFGFGFKWDINRDWSINTSLGGRNLFTDYIDDVSDRFPDFATLEARRGITAAQLSNRSLNPDFAIPGQQRGNGKDNDLVYFFTIGIMKYFGELPCPAISKIRY